MSPDYYTESSTWGTTTYVDSDGRIVVTRKSITTHKPLAKPSNSGDTPRPFQQRAWKSTKSSSTPSPELEPSEWPSLGEAKPQRQAPFRPRRHWTPVPLHILKKFSLTNFRGIRYDDAGIKAWRSEIPPPIHHKTKHFSSSSSSSPGGYALNRHAGNTPPPHNDDNDNNNKYKYLIKATFTGKEGRGPAQNWKVIARIYLEDLVPQLRRGFNIHCIATKKTEDMRNISDGSSPWTHARSAHVSGTQTFRRTSPPHDERQMGWSCHAELRGERADVVRDADPIDMISVDTLTTIEVYKATASRSLSPTSSTQDNSTESKAQDSQTDDPVGSYENEMIYQFNVMDIGVDRWSGKEEDRAVVETVEDGKVMLDLFGKSAGAVCSDWEDKSLADSSSDNEEGLEDTAWIRHCVDRIPGGKERTAEQCRKSLPEYLSLVL